MGLLTDESAIVVAPISLVAGAPRFSPWNSESSATGRGRGRMCARRWRPRTRLASAIATPLAMKNCLVHPESTASCQTASAPARSANGVIHTASIDKDGENSGAGWLGVVEVSKTRLGGIANKKVVGPHDVAVLDPSGNEILTLVSCYPSTSLVPPPIGS